MSVLPANQSLTSASERGAVRIAENSSGMILPLQRVEVDRTYREGSGLVVVLVSGSEILVEGFFTKVEAIEGFALLVGDGEDGEVAILRIDSEGGLAGNESVALGRLEEMFGGLVGIQAVQLPGSESTAIFGMDIDWNHTTLLITGGALMLGGYVLGDDGEEVRTVTRETRAIPSTEITHDLDGDGTDETYDDADAFAAAVLDASELSFDVDGDGTVESYGDADALATAVLSYDTDGDGTNEPYVDAAALAVAVQAASLTYDIDGDGTEETYANSVALAAAVLEVGLAFDLNADGTPDSRLIDDNGDGTADILELAEGAMRFEDSIIPGIRGVETIRMDIEGETEFTLTDTQLTALVGANPSPLVIEGGSNDYLHFVGGIYATGSEDSGYAVYAGEQGMVHVASDIVVVTTPKPLEDTGILDAPDQATVNAFSQAGIHGVTEENLDSVRTVLSAHSVAGSLQMSAEQMQQLVRTVNMLVDSAAGEEVLHVSTGSMVLIIAAVAESGARFVDRIVQVELEDATFLPTSAVISQSFADIALDGIHTIDTRSFALESDGEYSKLGSRHFNPLYPIWDTQLENLVGSRVETYTYDHLNRLIQRVVDSEGGSHTFDTTTLLNNNGVIETTTGQFEVTHSDSTSDTEENYDVDTRSDFTSFLNQALRVSVGSYGTLESAPTDVNSDGTPDRQRVDVYNDPSTSVLVDWHQTVYFSGTADTDTIIEITYDFANDGLGIADNDGTSGFDGSDIDGIAEYVYLSDGKLSTINFNWDSDEERVSPLFDEKKEYFYDANGTLERELHSISSADDGVYDEIVSSYYDGTGDDADYVSRKDGTSDQIEFRRGVDAAVTFAGTNVNDNGLRGISSVMLAGAEGNVAVTLSSAGMEIMADIDGDGTPDTGYVLTVDGELGDSITGSGIVRRDFASDTGGYRAYEGTAGTVLVAEDIRVHDILALTDTDSDSTVELAEVDFDGDGTMDQIDYDTDDDGTMDRSEIDLDDDGIVDRIVHDTDDNGTVDKVEQDYDGDGNFDLIEYDDDEDGINNLYEVDSNSNGTIDWRFYNTDDDAGTSDLDGDGTVENFLMNERREGDLNEDGIMEYLDLDIDDNGTFDIIAFDRSGDGTIDTAVYAQDHATTRPSGSAPFSRDDIGQLAILDQVVGYDTMGRTLLRVFDRSFDTTTETLQDGTTQVEVEIPVYGTDDGVLMIDGTIDEARVYHYSFVNPVAYNGPVWINIYRLDGNLGSDVVGAIVQGTAAYQLLVQDQIEILGWAFREVDVDGDGTTDLRAALASRTEIADPADVASGTNEPTDWHLDEVEYRLFPEQASQEPYPSLRVLPDESLNALYTEQLYIDDSGTLRQRHVQSDSVHFILPEFVDADGTTDGTTNRISAEYSYRDAGSALDSGLLSGIEYEYFDSLGTSATLTGRWAESLDYNFLLDDGLADLSSIERNIYQYDTDGTQQLDQTELYLFTDGRIDRVEIDSVGTDGSGSADGIYDNEEKLYYDLHQRAVFKVVDEHDGGTSYDGTADSLVLVDGLNHTLVPGDELLATLIGIDSVVLAGNNTNFAFPALTGEEFNGATTLHISDETLTALANGDSAYVLAVDGDANDIVMLSGMTRITGGQDSTDDDGRAGYRGTDGIIYVDPDVTVEIV